MLTHRSIDRICICAMILALIVTFTLGNGDKLGIQAASPTIRYENTLFDTSKVHEINIIMKDWNAFIACASNKKYSSCTIEIDGETLHNVGIRAKGSSSLDTVKEQKGSRYSFKIEFDHLKKGLKYQGLDKLSLNNIIFDSTYMMDYLTYDMMRQMGVASPLSSYVNISVNGKPWGLYLAVEGMEEAFLERNYGINYGKLYKPDDSEMDGGEAEEIEAVEDINWDEPMDDSLFMDTNLRYIDDNPESYSIFFKKNNISNQDKAKFVTFIRKLNEGKALEEVVDIEQTIRYFVIHNFVVNGDSYIGDSSHNYYLYEKDGRFTMIPWDYNLSFGLYDKETASSVINNPIDEVVLNRPMQNFIFENEDYIAMYHAYYKEFITQNNILQKIQQTNTLIAPYVKADVTKFCTYEAYEKAVQTLTEICKLRLASVAGQLEGKVPSTLAKQKEEPSKLIQDASLQLFDMLNSMEE